MERYLLGAYQVLDIERFDDEQYGPKAIRAKITSAMDHPFENRTLTLLLSANAQQMIIEAFTDNLKKD